MVWKDRANALSPGAAAAVPGPSRPPPPPSPASVLRNSLRLSPPPIGRAPYSSSAGEGLRDGRRAGEAAPGALAVQLLQRDAVGLARREHGDRRDHREAEHVARQGQPAAAPRGVDRGGGRRREAADRVT